jgi:hypothetical protein
MAALRKSTAGAIGESVDAIGVTGGMPESCLEIGPTHD